MRWLYVDLDAGAVHVWWQIGRANWRHGCDDPHVCGARFHTEKCVKACRRHAAQCPERHGGGLSFREPKGKSKRALTLPAELVPLLRAHRKAQVDERLAAGELWQDNDLVFCREDGRPISRTDDWRDWKDLLAGVRDVRVHDGRHTAGTLLIEQCVHVRTVQEILGHSRITVTERYTRVASPMQADAAERIGRELWG